MSKCGKCGGTLFEIEQQSPVRSAFKLYFIQCSSCKTPVGVLEYNNSGAMIKELESKVDVLISEVEQIGYDVRNIKNNLP